MKKVVGIVLITLVALLSGCATPTKMAFSSDTDSAQTINKPVFLMTATIRNLYKPGYQPDLIAVNVERAVVSSSADRINFTMDDKGKHETGSSVEGNNYLLRMELEQGEYVIRGLTSMKQSFPIMASFFTPLHAKLEVAAPGIYYLGHVEATIRERQGNEFKAGPSIPLVDQAVAGASGGTFDVVISDQWERDESQFRTSFPVLKDITIQKTILPGFDRAVAQQWWEAN